MIRSGPGKHRRAKSFRWERMLIPARRPADVMIGCLRDARAGKRDRSAPINIVHDERGFGGGITRGGGPIAAPPQRPRNHASAVPGSSAITAAAAVVCSSWRRVRGLMRNSTRD